MSWILWPSEGDANTELFHLCAKHRRRKNFITKLITEEGEVFTSHEDKKKKSFLIFIVSCLGKVLIEMSWKTTGLLPANKAPGPTVLQGNFYQCCWPVIKDDVMAVVSAIWSRKFMNFEQLKSAYITLLMKKDEATSIRDFRPVSLVHSFIKIGIAVCLMVFPQK